MGLHRIPLRHPTRYPQQDPICQSSQLADGAFMFCSPCFCLSFRRALQGVSSSSHSASYVTLARHRVPSLVFSSSTERDKHKRLSGIPAHIRSCNKGVSSLRIGRVPATWAEHILWAPCKAFAIPSDLLPSKQESPSDSLIHNGAPPLFSHHWGLEQLCCDVSYSIWHQLCGSSKQS